MNKRWKRWKEDYTSPPQMPLIILGICGLLAKPLLKIPNLELEMGFGCKWKRNNFLKVFPGNTMWSGAYSATVFLQTECGRGLAVDLSECPTTSGEQFITANLFAFPLVLPISFLFWIYFICFFNFFFKLSFRAFALLKFIYIQPPRLDLKKMGKQF